MKQNKLYILSFMFLLLWGITSCENESPPGYQTRTGSL